MNGYINGYGIVRIAIKEKINAISSCTHILEMVSGAERGNRKDSRGIIPNRVSIENRPAIVSKRKRAGDIEVDLMMGKNHKGALLVLTDRATLYTRLKLPRTKESGAVKEGILACLQNSNSLFIP